MDKEKHIIESWIANATSWIELIESNGIESRKLVTNKAIVDAVCSSKPSAALDMGCGEGWLAAALQQKGIDVTGVDVIPELIDKAKKNVQGHFFVASYEDIAEGKILFDTSFDTIVINFALIGKESTESLLPALKNHLQPGGRLFIQTLHPYNRKEIKDYVTGWKEGSWDGLGDQFTMPYQWYFRTMEDWIALLDRSGFKKIQATDVRHPHSGKKLSVIFECRVQ